MPIPIALAAGIIQGGSGLLGQAANIYSQSRTNRLERQQTEKMYNWQRRDALSDWATTNAYNNPSAVMKRYTDAGLNPNLIYGQTNEAAPVRSSQAQTWSPSAPQVDTRFVGDTINTMYATKVQQATTDNLNAQNTVILQDALLKKAQTDQTLAQTGSLLANTDLSKFDFELKKTLRQNTIDMAQSQLQQSNASTDQTRANTNYTINQDVRAAAMQSSNLKEAAERVLRSMAERSKIPYEKREIEARISNLSQDTKLKELDAMLKNNGVQPHDALWQRTLFEFLQQFKDDRPANVKMKETIQNNANNRQFFHK